MLDKNKKKVIVGMSGGVDSSVSVWLLQQQGYQVEGVFMKNWEEDDKEEYCTSSNDLEDTKKVCDKLGVMLHTVNFSAEYWNNVFIPFLTEYQQYGRTPNPDIICNKEIKFKLFLKFAIEDLNANFIATGHYVRCIKIDGKNRLLRGLDKKKDQSYFLYTIGYDQLAYCIFPIGTFTKPEVRKIAINLKLTNAKKKDSTGICFIGKRKFRDFISRYLPDNPGDIVTVKNKKIGMHQGLMYYTIGQRKGLGLGGFREDSNDPWYVVDKDVSRNLLIVAQGLNHPRLMSTSLIANHIHWIDREPLKKSLYCTMKIRYRQSDIGCLVKPLSDNLLLVSFNRLVESVTPGQSVVFYLSEYCLGGGIIEERKFCRN